MPPVGKVNLALKGRRYVDANEKKNFRVSILGMNNNTAVLDIIMFEGLIQFLNDKHNIDVFWMDEESADSAYEAILAMYCNSMRNYFDTQVKVFIASANDDVER